MKYIYCRLKGLGSVRSGLVKTWVGCVLGLAVFLSAAGSVALADSTLTQQQYIQWMASICGEKLPGSTSGQDLINWARGKGMNPSGGWQLNAKLSKDVVAQTVVQLLNLAPRKGVFDANRILEREGIIVTSNNGLVGVKDMAQLVNTGFGARVNGNSNGNGNANGHGDDDDDRPTGTKPGNGNGGSGPPGHTGIFPGKGHGYGRANHF
jgi:hypothetical protein